jgi:hypothetical protein
MNDDELNILKSYDGYPNDWGWDRFGGGTNNELTWGGKKILTEN